MLWVLKVRIKQHPFMRMDLGFHYVTFLTTKGTKVFRKWSKEVLCLPLWPLVFFAINSLQLWAYVIKNIGLFSSAQITVEPFK
ncbi:MAG: hypothetical protein ACI8Q1_002968 [Parvicella sp.]|jgi:hypothetical protein